MTKEQERELIRVCGENYSIDDIPAYWKATKKLERRKAEFKNHKEKGLLTNEEAERLLVKEQVKRVL